MVLVEVAASLALDNEHIESYLWIATQHIRSNYNLSCRQK